MPFANLINISLSQSVFPDAMKCAEVSPIFKKDDNLLKWNFRPVSILTSLSKIYETVLNNQLLRYFLCNFQLYPQCISQMLQLPVPVVEVCGRYEKRPRPET